LFKIFVYK